MKNNSVHFRQKPSVGLTSKATDRVFPTGKRSETDSEFLTMARRERLSNKTASINSYGKSHKIFSGPISTANQWKLTYSSTLYQMLWTNYISSLFLEKKGSILLCTCRSLFRPSVVRSIFFDPLIWKLPNFAQWLLHEGRFSGSMVKGQGET